MKKRILVLFLALLISLTTLNAYAKEDATQTLLGIKFGLTKEQWLRPTSEELMVHVPKGCKGKAGNNSELITISTVRTAH